MGAVERFKKRYDEADQHFEKAKDLAKAQNSSNSTAYALLWAGVRLDDPSYDQEKVRERAAKVLREVPNERVFRQQLAGITGKSYEVEAANLEDDLKKLSGVVRLAQERKRDQKRTEALHIYERRWASTPAKMTRRTSVYLRSRIVVVNHYDARVDPGRLRDSDRILELATESPQWSDFHQAAVAYSACWLIDKSPARLEGRSKTSTERSTFRRKSPRIDSKSCWTITRTN